MKVRMLTHYSRGGPDHISVNHYNGGQKYDLPESEAMLFIDMGIAVEDKDMERAPEVKADTDRQDNYAPIYP